MGQAVVITRTEHTADALRGHAAKSGDAAQVRRLLAMALILDGRPRTAAAEQCGMDRQTLRDWVHRYNAEGIAGLISRVAPGAKPSLSEPQMAELKALVIAGPDPETDGIVRWRCLDLREQITRRFSVALHERSVGKLLRRLELTRLQPRPYHPKKDEAAQETFKKLPRSSRRGVAGLCCGQAGRSMAQRRSQGGPEGLDCLCLGADRLAPTDGAGQPP